MEKQESSPTSQLDAWSILAMVWRWKLFLLIVVVVAAGAAYGICKLLSPLYESHAILLPGSSNSRDKLLEEFRYGYEVDSERLMQMLGSETILDSLEAQLGLCASWGIDKSEKQWYDLFVRMSKERLQFHKTRHSSVVVSAIDEDPVRAAKIANEASRLVNVVNAQILKASASEVLLSVEKEFKEHLQGVEVIHDTIGNVLSANSANAISKLRDDIKATEGSIARYRDTVALIRRKLNIFDYGYQVNVLNEQLAEARSSYLQFNGALEEHETTHSANDTLILRIKAGKAGAKKRVDYFEQQLNALSAISSRYSSAIDKLSEDQTHLAFTKSELDKLMQSIEPKVNTRGLARLEMELDFDQYRLNELRAKYETALSNYYNPSVMAHMVSPARPSYLKIYPNTILSIILSVLGSLMMAVVFIAILEHFRKANA